MGNNLNYKTPVGRNGKKKYHQDFYLIKNLNKYIGDPTKCFTRSKWEYNFCVYCDMTPEITKWGCETLTIPYQDENGKFHRYYPDFYIEVLNKNKVELIDRLVIEIKPLKEINPPFVTTNGLILKPEQYLKKITNTSLESYEYQVLTYQKNLYKWTKAKIWCEKNKFTFKLLHEEKLKEYKIL
jgi:hypothetical protein